MACAEQGGGPWVMVEDRSGSVAPLGLARVEQLLAGLE